MNIDKTDFLNLLAESGSTITAPDASTFNAIPVLLQSSHQLPDIKLEPGDLIAYVDPANSFILGGLFSFAGHPFVLVSARKVKHIGDNSIYRLLGFRQFVPGIELQSGYSILVSLSISLPSIYQIDENIISKRIASSYSIEPFLVDEKISATISLACSYQISEDIVSKLIASSYSIEPIFVDEKSSATISLPSSYQINETITSKFIASSYTIEPSEKISATISFSSSYQINEAIISKFIASSYSIEPILADEKISATISLPSSYQINENIVSKFVASSYSIEPILADEKISATISLPSSYQINENIISKFLASSYSIEPILADEKISATISLACSYQINENILSKFIASSYSIEPILADEKISATISLPSSYDIFTAPAQVTGLRVDFNSPQTIILYWNSLDDIDHFEVHRSTTPGFSPSSATFVGTPSSGTNSFANRDLETNTSYYFKVCAVDANGNKGAYSAQITETTS